MSDRWQFALGAGWLTAAMSMLGVGLLPVGHRMAPYLALHAAMSALSLGWYMRVVGWSTPRPAAQAAGRSSARAALVLSMVAQLGLLWAPPLTSTDPGRYVWDGAVVLEGVDPYRVAPDDPRLDTLAERFERPADHRDVPTCYPPLALAVFATAATGGPQAAPFLLSLFFALAACALTWLVHRKLTSEARPADTMLLALSPLVLLETSVGSHVEILVALALTLAALHAAPGRGVTAGCMIGVAALIKVWPIVLAVVLLRHVARARFVAGLTLGMLPLLLTTAALGHPPVGSLSLMAQTWSFGSPLWLILRPFSTDEGPLRVGLAVASGLACILIGWRARHPASALLAGVLAMLLGSPTLYPWYGVSLVPLAVLAPSSLRALALGLALVLPLSYEVVDGYQRDGGWQPAQWPALLTLTVILGTLAYAAWLRRPAIEGAHLA